MTSISHYSSNSSAAESAMEDPSNRSRRRHKSLRHRPSATVSTTTGESDGEVEDGDPEVWASLDRGFRQVQSVLDRNRALIQQVNDNQQSRLPDNMVKNVSLIHELNGNISKVVNLYSDINSNFTNSCTTNRRGSNNSTR